MHIRQLRQERRGGAERLSAIIQYGRKEYPLYFQAHGVPIAGGLEPFVTMALLPAMRERVPLLAEGPLSPRLRRSLEAIQQHFSERDPRLKIIEVHTAGQAPPETARSERVATFFSGGVDSFFTLLENQEQITDLIYVHGYDIPVENQKHHCAALASLEGVAAHYGKRLIHVETNLREFGDRYADWAFPLHGAALAAVAQLLRPAVGRVYFPGEYVSTLRCHATHPELDGLWSTESVETLSHGHDVTRVQKLGRVGADAMAQQSLRVCWQNVEGRFNCGVCGKCLRNMAALRAHGYLDKMTTFPPLDLRRLASLELPANFPHMRETTAEILACAETRGTDPELVAALRECLAQRAYRGPMPAFRRAVQRLSHLARRVPERLNRALNR
jgi:hypothetical protein